MLVFVIAPAFFLAWKRTHADQRLPWWAWALFAVLAVATLAAGAWWDEQSRWPEIEHLRGDEPPEAPPPKADPPA
jgi:hypothetical protein